MWQIIIVILGILLGFYLGNIAKDEVKNGRKYFLFFESVILLILILIFVKLSFLMLIGAVIGAVICKFFKQIYFYLGILVLCASFISKEIFLASISLVFLFSLIFEGLNKSKLKNFLLDVILFLIPFSLLFVESFINSNLSILIGFSIGAVIEWALSSAW